MTPPLTYRLRDEANILGDFLDGADAESRDAVDIMHEAAAEIERLQAMERRLQHLADDCARGRKECQIKAVPAAFRQYIAMMFRIYGRELRTTLAGE